MSKFHSRTLSTWRATIATTLDEALFDPKTGALNVARCSHVLGVKQPLPAGIEFVENFEFDSCDGNQISGRNLLDALSELDRPFVPVLDAGYQFAVSIGIYIQASEDIDLKEAA